MRVEAGGSLSVPHTKGVASSSATVWVSSETAASSTRPGKAFGAQPAEAFRDAGSGRCSAAQPG